MIGFGYIFSPSRLLNDVFISCFFQLSNFLSVSHLVVSEQLYVHQLVIQSVVPRRLLVLGTKEVAIATLVDVDAL